MGSVHHLPSTGAAGPGITRAAESFLLNYPRANTARSYRTALAALAAEFGADTPVGALDREENVDRVATWFLGKWGSCAPATVNVRLDALRSSAAWWREQGWLTGDPTRRIRRRALPAQQTRAIERELLLPLLADPRHRLREKLLWTMLYESAARAQEVLGLDVGELDRPNRRAKVRRKGGAADTITWRTGTARLLPRYLEGRTRGPLILTDRRARLELPARDIDPDTGRARLSYRRAEELFAAATAGQPGGPWELHQLRHSALTHAAEDGASSPMLMALSGHTNIASVARYAKVSPAALARWQNEHDPAARRR